MFSYIDWVCRSEELNNFSVLSIFFLSVCESRFSTFCTFVQERDQDRERSACKYTFLKNKENFFFVLLGDLKTIGTYEMSSTCIAKALPMVTMTAESS